MTGRARDTATYLVGYALALALTASAFAIVRWWNAPPRTVFATVVILAAAQSLVHLRCFLHLSWRKSARPDLLLVLFTAIIVTLMVSGTMVVIFNLHGRMM